MNRILILTISLLATTLHAQQISQKVDSTSYSIDFTLKNDKDKGLYLALNKSALQKEILNFQAELIDADLILKIEIKKPSKNEFYFSNINLKENNKSNQHPTQQNLENSQSITKKSITNTLIWKNITEGKIFPGSQYKLTYQIYKNRNLGINCNDKPTFKFKQQVPYYGVILLGAGRLIDGLSKNSKINARYANVESAFNEYIQVWEQGQSESGQIAATEQNYDAAVDLETKRNKRITEGSIILGVGVASFLGRYFGFYKPKLKLYNKYCPNSTNTLELQPKLDINPVNDYAVQLGLNLTYTF